MKIGYIRVSTADQNPERQRTELEAVGVEEIYEDRVSGKNLDRPQLQEMLAFIRKGDTIIVHSLDRLSRNLSDLLKNRRGTHPERCLYSLSQRKTRI